MRRARSCHAYRVLVVGAFAPLDATLARGAARAREEGRHIAEGFARKIFSEIWPGGQLDTQHFEKYCVELLPGDAIWLYDNTGSAPTLAERQIIDAATNAPAPAAAENTPGKEASTMPAATGMGAAAAAREAEAEAAARQMAQRVMRAAEQRAADAWKAIEEEAEAVELARQQAAEREAARRATEAAAAAADAEATARDVAQRALRGGREAAEAAAAPPPPPQSQPRQAPPAVKTAREEAVAVPASAAAAASADADARAVDFARTLVQGVMDGATAKVDADRSLANGHRLRAPVAAAEQHAPAPAVTLTAARGAAASPPSTTQPTSAAARPAATAKRPADGLCRCLACFA